MTQEFSDDDCIDSDIAGDESESDEDGGDFSSAEDTSTLQTDMGEVFVVSSVLGKTVRYEGKLAFLNQSLVNLQKVN